MCAVGRPGWMFYDVELRITDSWQNMISMLFIEWVFLNVYDRITLLCYVERRLPSNSILYLTPYRFFIEGFLLPPHCPCPLIDNHLLEFKCQITARRSGVGAGEEGAAQVMANQWTCLGV